MNSFTLTKVVAPEDLDALNHVNNVRYLQWIQEVSEGHWMRNASVAQQEVYIWVVRKHEITYYDAAKLGEELRLETHIAASKGPISVRKVTIKNNKTNALLVSATTDWCLVSPKTMKPARIPEEIKLLFNSSETTT